VVPRNSPQQPKGAPATAESLQAGPSRAPDKETERGTALQNGPDGSYYSFQRGGPGGFSYKIKL